MAAEDDPELSVEEFAEYCRTQSGLLSGQVERIGGEIETLLDEMDRELAAIRDHLDELEARSGGPDPTARGGGPTGGAIGNQVPSGDVDDRDGEPGSEVMDATSGVEDATAEESDDSPVPSVDEAAADLERTESLVEAEQARMRAFQELAAEYAELAATLESDVTDGRVALERVIAFEAERDAPAYFPDRQTVLEASGATGDGED